LSKGIIAAIIVVALTAGGVLYHHITGARFRVTLVSVPPPPIPTTCSGRCPTIWRNSAWFRGTLVNSGHRGAFASCTATGFDSSGKRLFSTTFVPGNRLQGLGPPGTGSYTQAGQSIRWIGSLWLQHSQSEIKDVSRYSSLCQGIEYQANEPV
jgi:hypothetical protein